MNNPRENNIIRPIPYNSETTVGTNTNITTVPNLFVPRPPEESAEARPPYTTIPPRPKLPRQRVFNFCDQTPEELYTHQPATPHNFHPEEISSESKCSKCCLVM